MTEAEEMDGYEEARKIDDAIGELLDRFPVDKNLRSWGHFIRTIQSTLSLLRTRRQPEGVYDLAKLIAQLRLDAESIDEIIVHGEGRVNYLIGQRIRRAADLLERSTAGRLAAAHEVVTNSRPADDPCVICKVPWQSCECPSYHLG